MRLRGPRGGDLVERGAGNTKPRSAMGCTPGLGNKAIEGEPYDGATQEGLSSRDRRGVLGAGRYSAQSRKEVIQPQVPLRLPCYDFAPVTTLAFGRLAWIAPVPARTSGARRFHGVTGGVYKARERIHRGVADPRLLAIPASCRRVAGGNPN
jgi:hypothetical protein